MIKGKSTNDIDLSDEETGAQLQVLIALSLYKNCIRICYNPYNILQISVWSVIKSLVKCYTSAALLMVRLAKSW